MVEELNLGLDVDPDSFRPEDSTNFLAKVHRGRKLVARLYFCKTSNVMS